MTLPNLSNERLEQMICLACSCSQDACKASRLSQWYKALGQKTKHLFYGVSATAVSFSCLAVFMFLPATTPQTDMNGTELTFSDYLMQDMLEDLG